MRHDTQRPISVGDNVELNVIEFNGKPVFESEFIQYDSELCDRDLKARGIDDEYAFDGRDQFYHDYANGRINFRSVRIFHLVKGENIELKPGDKVRAKITSVRLDTNKTKDGRRKLHITVSNVMRIYRWTRQRYIQFITITLECGSIAIRKKIISFTCKQGIWADHGRAYPMIAEVLPNGSVLHAVPDTRRSITTTGDYRLAERQKGRTMRDIDTDFLRIPPSYDRLIPTRERRLDVRHKVT